MATKKNLGRVAFVYRSEFDPNAFYSRYDVVKYHGSLYHCTYNKSAYRKYNAPINEDGEFNSDWQLFLPGCDFVGQNIISSDETIIVKETDKGYDLSTKHTVVKAADGSKNVTIKFDKTTNTYTVSVVDNKITTAQWKNWWIKYPWEVSYAPQSSTYLGPMHYSSNGLNLIGMDYSGSGCTACVADNGSMVAITEPEDGIIPVINWNMQYDLGVNSSYGTELQGLTFNQYDANGNLTQRPLYIRGTQSTLSTCAGFCLSGEGGYTKAWSSGGAGAQRYSWKNNHFGQIVAIISITPNLNFPNAYWHFHVQTGLYQVYWDNTTGRFISGLTKYKKVGDVLEQTTEDFIFEQNKYFALLGDNSACGIGGIRPLNDDEVKTYIKDSQSSQSEASVTNKDITFTITVGGVEHNITKSISELPSPIIIDSNTMTYDCPVGTNTLTSDLIYTFTTDNQYILSIDKDAKQKRIFRKGETISIPYYSGCTFIKNT